ncbi:flagellar basal body-associated FliL family protein [bacterium]|nr:flagellar basal body-associated FliL family protein [bacterium]
MAEDELLLDEEEEEKKPSIFSNPVVQIIAIVIGCVAVAIIAALVSGIVANSFRPHNIVVNPEREEEKVLPPESLHIYDMGGFLVRLTDPDLPRYLKLDNVTLAYGGEFKEFAPEIGERKRQIKSLINDTLITKSSDVATYEGKQALKKELIEKINAILVKGKIADIYMEVLIQ